MSEKSRALLKTKFQAGDAPSERDFGDVLDSYINKSDDQITIQEMADEGEDSVRFVGIGSDDPESPLSIKNRRGNPNLIRLEDPEGKERWLVEVNPDQGDEGLNITESGNESSNLFIRDGGRVGIGTKTPSEKLTVQGKVEAEEFVGQVKWENILNVPPSAPLFPKGGIIMWSGSQEEIPEGWLLCNGKKGTPDLQDRFVVSTGPNIEVNSKGDADQHDHGYDLSGHAIITTTDGQHEHDLPAGWTSMQFDDGTNPGIRATPSSVRPAQMAGAHNHTVPLSGVAGKTTSYQGENRPRWYALCFIMKS